MALQAHPGFPDRDQILLFPVKQALPIPANPQPAPQGLQHLRGNPHPHEAVVVIQMGKPPAHRVHGLQCSAVRLQRPVSPQVCLQVISPQAVKTRLTEGVKAPASLHVDDALQLHGLAQAFRLFFLHFRFQLPAQPHIISPASDTRLNISCEDFHLLRQRPVSRGPQHGCHRPFGLPAHQRPGQRP